MSCPGSTSATSYGSPGPAHPCGRGQVLVGLDLYYTPPANVAGFHAGAVDHDDVSFGGSLDTDGEPISVWIPGAVLGISAFYCASADSVFVGSAAPQRVATGYSPLAGERLATFLCPAGQALTGATAWVDPGTGNTEQIRLQCTRFAAGTPAGASSPSYPARRMPGSAAAPRALSTLGTPPAALFANAIAQGWGGAGDADGPLRALGFGCEDYADEFDSSPARRLACCTGTAANPELCQGFAGQTGDCDAFMAQFCATDCAPGGGCLHAACGCLGSPVGRPECYDARCADTPGAYLTAQMVAQKPSCPTTVTCPIWQALGDGRFLAKEIIPPAGCTPSPSFWSKSVILLLVIAFIFLVFLAGVIGRSGGAKRAPMFMPPPPGLFT
jgi:hypothetical protein